MAYIGASPADRPIQTSDIEDNAISVAKLASTLDLSSNTVTLPSGVGGKVLQVVQTSTDANTTVSSAANTFSELTAFATSITPSSTSSKILVMVSVTGGAVTNLSNITFRLRKDTTDIGISTTATGSRPNISFGGIGIQENNTLSNANFQFLDSPATISEITYKLMASGSNSGQVNRINATSLDSDAAYAYRSVSTMTLMEISN